MAALSLYSTKVNQWPRDGRGDDDVDSEHLGSVCKVANLHLIFIIF